MSRSLALMNVCQASVAIGLLAFSSNECTKTINFFLIDLILLVSLYLPPCTWLSIGRFQILRSDASLPGWRIKGLIVNDKKG